MTDEDEPADELERYDPDEWEGGLRCAQCDTAFVEGQQVCSLLEGFIGEIPCTLIVCQDCSVKAAYA